jgi:hypothetical protein
MTGSNPVKGLLDDARSAWAEYYSRFINAYKVS